MSDRALAAFARVADSVAPGRSRAELLVRQSQHLRDAGLWVAQHASAQAAYTEDPTCPAARHALGLVHLRAGDFATGLPLYDAGRAEIPDLRRHIRPHAYPKWAGEDLRGKRMLVWAEQGLGDQIMQTRALDALRALGADITVECDPRLIPLLTPTRSEIAFHPMTEPVWPAVASKTFDYQTSMFSAWAHLSPMDPHALTAPAMQGPPKDKINIGLSWFSKAGTRGAERSVPLELLSPLSTHRGLRFHNLQYDAGDLAAASKLLNAPLQAPPLDTRKDIAALAGFIKTLDLVITIDNTTAHLAGALGVPTWLILPVNCDWRWGTGSKATALYPSLKLYRATQTGDWTAALWPLWQDAKAL